MHHITRRSAIRLCGPLASWALVVASAISIGGCAKLGYSDRVLHRVPSPAGQMTAVCQEIPELDGPSYDIRLERPDGTVVRRLYQIGDGDRCGEIAWAPDGRTLAVLSGHVARVRFVDVAWALEHPSVETMHWSWRQVDFGTERLPMTGSNLRFVGPLEIEVLLCAATRGSGRVEARAACAENGVRRRLLIPTPIVTGHPNVQAVR